MLAWLINNIIKGHKINNDYYNHIMNLSNILIIVPSFNSGGTISSLINFVSLVDKSKFHISVFAITNSGPNKEFVAEHCEIVGEGNSYQGLKTPSFKRKLRTKLLSVVKSVKKQIEKANIDISPFLFKQYVKRLDKGEYDYILAFQEGQATLFGSYFKHGKKIAWVRCEYTRLITEEGDKYNSCYAHYDKIVSVSKAALSSFLSVLPQYSDRAYVQYNFLNDERILALSNEKADNIWDSKLFTIVTLGRIDPVKRVSEIPLICRQILDKGLNFRWVVIGGIAVKDEYNKLMDNINNYKVKENVLVIGNKPNPYPYLKRADLLVSLSSSETFNNTLTEAKILGVPVVTTNYLCAYESIEHKKEGLVVGFENIVPELVNMISDTEHIYTTIKEYLSSYHYNKQKLLEQLYTNVLS